MNTFGMDILPQQTQQSSDAKYNRDKECYLAGKADRQQELPRAGGVYSSNQRDVDCYNMGYSYEDKLMTGEV